MYPADASIGVAAVWALKRNRNEDLFVGKGSLFEEGVKLGMCVDRVNELVHDKELQSARFWDGPTTISSETQT